MPLLQTVGSKIFAPRKSTSGDEPYQDAGFLRRLLGDNSNELNQQWDAVRRELELRKQLAEQQAQAAYGRQQAGAEAQLGRDVAKYGQEQGILTKESGARDVARAKIEQQMAEEAAARGLKYSGLGARQGRDIALEYAPQEAAAKFAAQATEQGFPSAEELGGYLRGQRTHQAAMQERELSKPLVSLNTGETAFFGDGRSVSVEPGGTESTVSTAIDPKTGMVSQKTTDKRLPGKTSWVDPQAAAKRKAALSATKTPPAPSIERESQEAIDQFTPPVAGGLYDMPQAPVDTSRFQGMLGSGSPVVKQVNSPIQFNSPRSKPLRAYKSSL